MRGPGEYRPDPSEGITRSRNGKRKRDESESGRGPLLAIWARKRKRDGSAIGNMGKQESRLT